MIEQTAAALGCLAVRGNGIRFLLLFIVFKNSNDKSSIYILYIEEMIIDPNNKYKLLYLHFNPIFCIFFAFLGIL